jgi:purine nucleosidase
VRNAIVTLELCGRGDVPVYAGAAGPAGRPLETAQFVHGEDGMAGVPLPDPSHSPSDQHAVAALVAIAASEPGQYDLVTLGPLTNIAAALHADAGLLTRFNHTWLMAGSPDGVGNINAMGEYNVWADPEAAAAVFAADGSKTMIGWNISRKHAVITPDEQEHLRALGPLGEFAVSINAAVDHFARDHGLIGFDLPDPIAMAVALDDSIIEESTDEWLVIGLDEPTRGCTIPDRRFERTAPNIRVVWKVNEAAFKQRLYEACTPQQRAR